MLLKKLVRRVAGDVVNLIGGYYDLDVDIFIESEHLTENSAELEILGEGVYTIVLDKKLLRENDLVDTIKCIAHEMVHVKQHEHDGLDLETSMFKGVEWGGDYWFAPWEVEARGLEEAFLMHFLSLDSKNFLTN